MRLLSLDLERYGPFSGRRLDFRPDARLHVVLGPNEAGKTCALAAVTDLLFGTRDTRYEFLHRDTGLRLGAEVVARDGARLAFHRRRGGKSTLTDVAGKALSDDALVPFLGGLTRSVFCNAFGLDADSLRLGAKEMLKSDGEIGATLFAAASGLRGYRDAASDLDAEAAKLFKPTARKLRLNDLIGTYNKARSEARADQVGAENWKAIVSGLAATTTTLDRVSARRCTIAEETSRLRRLRAVAPILAEIDGLAGELAAFDALPLVDDTSRDELESAVTRVAGAAERLADRQATLVQADAALAAIATDDTVRPWLDFIDALAPGGGAYGTYQRDLPRVSAERDGFEAKLAALATRLGHADAGVLQSRQPSDPARAELKALLASGRELEAERRRMAASVDRLRATLAEMNKARDARGSLVDPSPLALAHEALAPALEVVVQRDALRAEAARKDAEIARAAARMIPPLLVGADGKAPALPSSEAIARHGEAIADATQTRDGAHRRSEAIETELEGLRARMRSREAGREVPDPGALERLRRERDEAAADIRAAAFGDPGASGGPDLARRASAFDRATMAADALADRLIADAQRAADQAADARRAEQLDGERDRAAAEHASAAEGVVAVQEAWKAVWATSSVTPSSPAAMAEWRSRAAGLLAGADALAQTREEAERLAAQAEVVRPQIEALAARLHLPAQPGLDLALLDGSVRERLRVLAETWNEARDGAARIASAAEGLRDGEAALLALTGRQAVWRDGWAEALAACSFPPGTTLDGAGAALEAWAEVPALVEQRDDRRGRVDGMKREMASHEAEVRRLAVATGLAADDPAPQNARALAARARAARATEAARDTQTKHRDEAARVLTDATSASQVATAALDVIVARLGLASSSDLPTLIARLKERSALATRLRDKRDELLRAGEGVPEAELRAGLAGLGVDAIEGELSRLASEAEDLDQQGRVAHSERDRLGADRSRLEGGTGSEVATARKSAAEVEIRETARRFLVLKLGSLLLDAAVDRHRTGQQDPLVARAGALFSELTGGTYTGIEQVFDERDQPTLAGRRADGRLPVAMANMSEGACDQLFLALRLAYLEDYAGRAEPAPFIGDDIFASFDDTRTEHGLAALATIGAVVQPILFTHHGSVVEAARKGLGEAADIITL